MLAVLAPGPSSKVKATVLPLPGAALLAPYGAAGQLVDTCGERACGGVATWPLGIRAGGPAGPSLPGGGWAAAAGPAKAPTTPRAITAAKSRNRLTDTVISDPVPARTRTARTLRGTNSIELIRDGWLAIEPCGPTTRDLWQAFSPVPPSRALGHGFIAPHRKAANPEPLNHNHQGSPCRPARSAPGQPRQGRLRRCAGAARPLIRPPRSQNPAAIRARKQTQACPDQDNHDHKPPQSNPRGHRRMQVRRSWRGYRMISLRASWRCCGAPGRVRARLLSPRCLVVRVRLRRFALAAARRRRRDSCRSRPSGPIAAHARLPVPGARGSAVPRRESGRWRQDEPADSATMRVRAHPTHSSPW